MKCIAGMALNLDIEGNQEDALELLSDLYQRQLRVHIDDPSIPKMTQQFTLLVQTKSESLGERIQLFNSPIEALKFAVEEGTNLSLIHI